MDASLQWQSPCAQTQTLSAVVTDSNQWQSSQPALCAPAATMEAGAWVCPTTITMAKQSGHPMLMMQVAPPWTNCSMPQMPPNGATSVVPPCHAISATGFDCDAAQVTPGWPAQSFNEPLALVSSAATESGHWWGVPYMQAAEYVSQPIYYLQVSPAKPSWDNGAPALHRVMACAVNDGASSGVLAVQNSEAPKETSPSVLFQSKHLLLDAIACRTPPGTGFCTPEVTPRRAPRWIPEQSNLDSQHLCANVLPHVVNNIAELTHLQEHPQQDEQCWLERESCDDAFSEYGADADEQGLTCWDFDIHAALAIRAQRDLSGYASSDTSTAVSRSARRRRGRRAAKAKAQSSMVIMESPPNHQVLVSEDKKMELIQQLEAGGDIMHQAVSSLTGSVLRMSLEPFGCRVIQCALGVASMAEKDALVAELSDHVNLMVASPHGNFVIQKVIEVLPVNSTSFVAEELATSAVEVAQHRFGCRVLSRLVEHHLSSETAHPSANDLIDKLLSDVDQLIRHNFARHVLELILEHGTKSHKQAIARAIRGNVFYYAKNRCASYVIEKAINFCSTPDTIAIASELVTDPEQFLAVAMHECGTHVAKAVIKSRTDSAQTAKELLLAEAARVKSSKYGKRLLEEM